MQVAQEEEALHVAVEDLVAVGELQGEEAHREAEAVRQAEEVASEVREDSVAVEEEERHVVPQEGEVLAVEGEDEPIHLSDVLRRSKGWSKVRDGVLHGSHYGLLLVLIEFTDLELLWSPDHLFKLRHAADRGRPRCKTTAVRTQTWR